MNNSYWEAHRRSLSVQWQFDDYSHQVYLRDLAREVYIVKLLQGWFIWLVNINWARDWEQNSPSILACCHWWAGWLRIIFVAQYANGRKRKKKFLRRSDRTRKTACEHESLVSQICSLFNDLGLGRRSSGTKNQEKKINAHRTTITPHIRVFRRKILVLYHTPNSVSVVQSVLLPRTSPRLYWLHQQRLPGQKGTYVSHYIQFR